MSDLRQHFDDVWSFCQRANDGEFVYEGNRARWGELDKYMRELGPSWHGLERGITSKPQVARIMNEGWSEGAARLTQALDSISIPPAQSVRRRREWGDQGDELDMQRVYNGALDQAWRRMSRRRGSGRRRVHVFTDICAPNQITADALFWRAAATVKLVDLLSKAGYNVEMSAHIRLSERRNKVHVSYTVKPALGPLDLASVAGAVA